MTDRTPEPSAGSQVESAFPIIVSADLQPMLSFYADTLGAVPSYRFPPVGDAVYVALELGSSHLALAQDQDLSGSRPSPRFSLWLYVEDVETFIDRVRPVTNVVDEPADQPWGERVARILDPDGNLLTIGSSRTAGDAPVDPAGS